VTYSFSIRRHICLNDSFRATDAAHFACCFRADAIWSGDLFTGGALQIFSQLQAAGFTTAQWTRRSSSVIARAAVHTEQFVAVSGAGRVTCRSRLDISTFFLSSRGAAETFYTCAHLLWRVRFIHESATPPRNPRATCHFYLLVRGDVYYYYIVPSNAGPRPSVRDRRI